MPDPIKPAVDARPRRRGRRTPRALVLAGALVALFASTAAAQPPRDYAYPSEANPEPTTLVRVTVPGGFDWGDAGIGAVASLAMLTALGGVLGPTRRRHRRTRTGVGAI